MFRLGDWTFSPVDGSLERDGECKRLDPRLVSLLTLLMDREHELVDKQQILDVVWAETTVAKDAVTVAIYELRKALGDDARNPRYLETVPKRGYRLIAKTERMGEALPGRRSRRALWAAAATVLASICMALLWPRPEPSEEAVIAVAPFEHHSAEPDDYIASGIADTLIADLARIPNVSVLAHQSMGRLDARDMKTLAELGVTHVVTGSVTRHDARLRINVGLTRRGEATYDWSETYEGRLSELLPLQRQVAVSIASAIAHELEPLPPARTIEVPERATEAYLLGRYFWNRRDPASVQRSVKLFNDALEIEPSFARAWAGLADAHTFPGPAALELSLEEGYRRALHAAEKAQALDPKLGEAYVSSGAVRFVYEWDIEAAENDFNEALRLSPSSALAHQWYAELLSATGRHDSAIAHMREALRLDPRSVAILFDLFWVQYMAFDFPSAIETLDRTIELADEIGELDPTLFWSRARLEARLDRLDDALESLTLFFEGAGSEPTAEARAVMLDPSPDAFRRFRLDALQKLAARGEPYALSLASAYADAGMNAQALDWLEQAASAKDGAILWIAVNPDLEKLRAEPRFIELVQRIGVGGA